MPLPYTLPFTLGQKVSALTDNFATQDAAKWDYRGAATASSGQLSLPVTSSYANNVSSVLTYDATGSSVIVHLTQDPTVGNGSQEAHFYLTKSNANVDNTAHFLFNAGTTYMGEAVGAVNDRTTVSTTDRWWRIRESGGTTYWDTSADGVTWTNRRSKTSGISLASVYVGMMSGYWGTEPSPGTVIFDDVNLPPATTTASLTVTATPSAAATRTHNASASLAVTAAPSGLATRTHNASASLAVTASPPGVATRTHNASADLAATAAPAGSATLAAVVAASLTVTATVTGTGARTHNADSALAVTASPTGAEKLDAVSGASLTATAVMSAAAARTHNADTTLGVTATVSGAATLDAAGAAVLAVTAAPSSAGTVDTGSDFSADASLAVTATASGAATRTHNAAAALPVTAAPTTAVGGTQTLDASLDVTADLSGEGWRQTDADADLAVTADLSGAGQRTANVAASLAVTAATAGALTLDAVTAAILAVTAGVAAAERLDALTGAALAITATMNVGSGRGQTPTPTARTYTPTSVRTSTVPASSRTVLMQRLEMSIPASGRSTVANPEARILTVQAREEVFTPTDIRACHIEVVDRTLTAPRSAVFVPPESGRELVSVGGREA